MNRKINQVLVLGMHRSGTSCLSGILKDSGAYFGDVSLENTFNKKGNQENTKVNQINNIILENNGGSWFDPKTIETVSIKDKFRIFLYKREMKNAIRSLSIPTYGIKDPRMVYTYKYWKDKSSVIIGTFRHPEKVSKSLFARAQNLNGITKHYTLDDWCEVWYKYNLEFLTAYKKHNFYFVNFDWQVDQYLYAMKQIVAEVFNGQLSIKNDFFDSSLINENVNNANLDAKYQDLYEELNMIASKKIFKNV